MHRLFATTAIFIAAATCAAADPVEICLFEDDDHPALIEACTEALAGTDDPSEQGRFAMNRALAHDSMGNLEAALQDQILAGTYRPNWFLPFTNAATLSAHLGDEETELRMAQAAIDADPDNPRAYSPMLLHLFRAEDPAPCLPYAAQATDLLGHRVEWPFLSEAHAGILMDVAYCLELNGRSEDAMFAYLSANNVKPDDHWLVSAIASLAYAMEQDARAAQFAQQALAFDDPSYVDVDTFVGAHTYLGNLDTALDAVVQYADVLDAAEEDLGTRNFISWTLFLEGRAAEARPVMEAWGAWATARTEAGDPQRGLVWDTLAHLRAAEGDTEGAAEAFRLAFEYYEDADDVRALYRYELTQLGYEVADGDAGILAGLEACAATGPACRLIPDEDEVDP